MKFHSECPRAAWSQILPPSWNGLFHALESRKCPERKADIWYELSTDSGYGHQPAWSTLLDAMTVLEPYITHDTQQLGFKPRLLHIQMTIQTGFLQFLCRHANRIAELEIQTFVNKVQSYVESDSPILAQLNALQGTLEHVDVQRNGMLSQEKITEKIEGEAIVKPKQQSTVTQIKHDSGEVTTSRKVHLEDVIIIDLDSEDEEVPKRKRQKLADNDTLIGLDNSRSSDASKIGSIAEKMVCTYPDIPANDKKSVDSTVTAETETFDKRLEKYETESTEEFDSDIEIELSQGTEQAIVRLKEIWHNPSNSETCPDKELESLLSLTSQETEAAIRHLELTELNENSLLMACSHVVSVSGMIGYSTCLCFLKFALYEKVMTLTQNASRVLMSAFTMIANKYPKQLIDSVLVPCVIGTFDSPQLDLVSRLLKECFNEGTQLYFMKKVMVDYDLELKDSQIALIQALLEIVTIDNEIMSKILNLFERKASDFAKNLKYGKLLLAIVNKCGKLLLGDSLTKFSSIVDKHQTFVKKSIENAIKKIKA